jgi:hypothetical protein
MNPIVRGLIISALIGVALSMVLFMAVYFKLES